MGIRFFGGSCANRAWRAHPRWLTGRVNFDMALSDRRIDYIAASRPLCAVLCPYRSARCFAQCAVQDSCVTESVPEGVLQAGYRDEVLGGAGGN